MMAKSSAAVMPARWLDVSLALLLTVIASPLIVVIAAALRIQNRGPVLYRQQRLGLNRRPLTLHKFRTLEMDAPEDVVIPEGDKFITPVGRRLRRYRLDELPQLFDVLTGNLALVGPRPELELDLAAVETDTLSQFLTIKPGITGPVQLEFIAEDELLAGVPDPTRIYREQLIPAKVAANLQAFEHWSLSATLACLLRTLFVLFSDSARARSRRMLARLSPQLGQTAEGSL